MKVTTFLALGLMMGTVASAQTDTTAVPPTSTSTVVLIDSSVGKAYVSRPERLLGLTTETLTSAHIFPAIGTYKSTEPSAQEVTITLDETNKGIVWVEGLAQGRFKAVMKKSPSTYKIPAQTSGNGKALAEGTLYLNPETNELKIIVGRPFNDANPHSFLTSTSKKSKTWQYTGIKADVGAAVTLPASQQ